MSAAAEPFRRSDGLPTIGLALITKNEAGTLPRLLDSVGWTELAEPGPPESWVRADDDDAKASGYWRTDAAVDFVVVCDTGSDDETVAIAQRRGCRVVTAEWTDDFGAARQVSYDALPDVAFTLWADGDDVIEGAEQLREIAARMPPNIAGTIHRYDYAQDEVGNCICELWRERLIRHGIGARWKLPIHEVLEVPGQMIHTPEVVWHHRTPPDRERDPERNYTILARDKAEAEARGEQPDPRTLAYLGTEALALGRIDEAIACFRDYLARQDARWDQERCQVAHKLAVALRAEQDAIPPDERDPDDDGLDDAVAAAYQAIQERPDWADGYLDLAEIALRRGQPERALAFCDTAQRLDPPQTLLIINPLEYSYQPELLRSIALTQLGRNEEAYAATEKVLATTPQRDDVLRQAAALRTILQADEAERHVLALREILVRHDENAKAGQLMGCVPYIVADRPAIAQARLDQREMVLHATDPETYRRYYRENPGETPFEAQGVPIPDAHKAFPRVAFLRDGLLAQALGIDREDLREQSDAAIAKAKGALAAMRVLDLSANDGWMLANLATADIGTGEGGVLDGLDLNRDASERAGKRPELAATAGRIVCDDLHAAAEHFEPGSYDAVVCYETIEHVPDPRATLALMAQMVKPGGRIYVSTPDGAYERGNVPDWWRVEYKGHLRALTAADVADLVAEVGLVHSLIPEQRLVVAEAEPRERTGKVIFYAGAVDALPERILDEGLGGSETALCKVAEHFARRGYDVRVYTGTEHGIRGDQVSVDGRSLTGGQVIYAPGTAWDPGEPCDLFVCSRVPEAFDRSIAAPRRALWLHDADYADRITPERIARTTDVIVLSDFQRGLLTDRYPELADANVVVSRNGIETSFYRRLPKKRKPWVVYSSSPDRGLDVLLEVWPAIRKRVPAAELHHTYAPVYHRFREQYPHLQAFHARVEELSAAAEGVVAHEAMGQRELAKLYAKARVWAYPSWTTPAKAPFPEISCITAVEAQAAGAVPVCLSYGALRETVVTGELVVEDGQGEDPGVIAWGSTLSAAWRERFVEAVVRGLTDDAWLAECAEVGRPWALERDWSGVCDEWIETLLSGAPEKVPA